MTTTMNAETTLMLNVILADEALKAELLGLAQDAVDQEDEGYDVIELLATSLEEQLDGSRSDSDHSIGGAVLAHLALNAEWEALAESIIELL